MKSEAVEVEKETIRGTEGRQGDWDAYLGVEGEGRQQEVRWESLNYVRAMGSCWRDSVREMISSVLIKKKYSSSAAWEMDRGMNEGRDPIGDQSTDQAGDEGGLS